MKNSSLLKRQVVFDKFKKIVQDTLILHDGKKLDWVYLDSPGSVIIVTLTSDKKIVLEKLYRYNLKNDVYENPAGAMDEGESNAVKVAERELLEETGYVPGELINLGKYYVLPGDTNRWVHIFLSLNSKKVENPKLDKIIEQYFDISIHLFDFEEIINKLGSSESLIQGIEHTYALVLSKNYLSKKFIP